NLAKSRHVAVLGEFVGQEARRSVVQVDAREIGPVEGDPAHFLVHHGNTTHTVAFRGFPRDEVLRVLALDHTKEGDRNLRGYFRFAESIGERDPRAAFLLLHAAVDDLRSVGSDWADALQAEAEARKALVAERERQAESLLASLEEAQGRNDYTQALVYADKLLAEEGLLFTDFVEKKRDLVERKRAELSRLARGDLLRVLYAVPAQPAHFEFSPESGQARITFTGAEWLEDEGKAPAEVMDKKAWAEARTDLFWRQHYDPKVEKLGFEAFKRRAMRQLRAWGEWAVPAPDGGIQLDVSERIDGRRAAPAAPEARVKYGPRLNQDHWTRDRTGEIRALTLENLFLASADWSVEFTVSWPEPEPVYFCVSGGHIHAGVLAFHKPYGGGRGTRIFLQDSPIEGIEGVFQDFHHHLLKP
ncbi:MAG: hypothetical protein ACREID_01200, partial [Planctomycetota bacterium]